MTAPQLVLVIALGLVVGCRTAGPEADAGGDDVGGADASSTCDPLTDETCQLVVTGGDGACAFRGHAPGDVPSLSAEVEETLELGELVAASRWNGGWYVATAAGGVVGPDGAIADLAGATMLDVSASAFGVAYSYVSGSALVVEVAAHGDSSREVMRMTDVAERPGGGVALDDDGTLFIGVGDGGYPWDAQDRSSTRGGVLRVNVSEPPYIVPEDNPHADGSGARELWAAGFRDPSRCAIVGDEVWCGDRGEDYVELNRVRRNGDHGWPYADGPLCVQSSCPEDQVAPLSHRPAGDDCELVPGAQMPDVHPDAEGATLWAGGCSGRLLGARITPDGVRATRRIGLAADRIIAVAADGDTVYTIADDGTVSRWELADRDAEFPRWMSQSGCFAPDGSFADHLLPYDVASALWTDGQRKRRFMSLPDGQTIEAHADGTFTFPDGTVFVKQFSAPLSDGTEQPIETRVMRYLNGDWDFYTYAWRGDDAELLIAGEQVAVDDPEGLEPYVHHIPSRTTCQSCHVESKRVLGPVWQQLDRTVPLVDERVAPQLDLFAAAGVLAGEAAVEPLPDPFDESYPIEARARSYLHANCSHCHRPGGWAPPTLGMDLRYDTPLAETGTCDVPAEFGRIWAPGDVRLDVGSPDNSNMLQRMRVTNEGRMPPVGTAVVDEAGAAVVERWIAQLTACE